jgi:hypothetical protein
VNDETSPSVHGPRRAGCSEQDIEAFYLIDADQARLHEMTFIWKRSWEMRRRTMACR